MSIRIVLDGSTESAKAVERHTKQITARVSAQCEDLTQQACQMILETAVQKVKDNEYNNPGTTHKLEESGSVRKGEDFHGMKTWEVAFNTAKHPAGNGFNYAPMVEYDMYPTAVKEHKLTYFLWNSFLERQSEIEALFAAGGKAL